MEIHSTPSLSRTYHSPSFSPAPTSSNPLFGQDRVELGGLPNTTREIQQSDLLDIVRQSSPTPAQPLSLNSSFPAPLQVKSSLTSFGNAHQNRAEALPISVYPQDPMISPLAIKHLQAKNLTFSPDGAITGSQNFTLQRAVHPNIEGNFIYSSQTAEFDTLNALFHAERAHTTMEKALDRKLNPHGEISQKTQINPHIIGLKNAFFHTKHNTVNTGVFFSDKVPPAFSFTPLAKHGDVVAHEVGHSVLNKIRPNWSHPALKPERDSISESFADLTTLFSMAKDPEVTKMVQEQTQGNLRKPNALSQIAEGFGLKTKDPQHPFIRTHLNSHKAHRWFTPKDPHGNSNVLTGAVYDIFAKVQQEQGKTIEGSQKSFQEKLQHTNQIVSKTFTQGVEYSPLSNPTTQDMALSMIRADKVNNQGKLSLILKESFQRRNLLSKNDLSRLDQELQQVEQVKDQIPFSQELMSMDGKEAQKWFQQHREKMKIPSHSDLKFSRSFTNDKGDHFLQFTQKRPAITQEGRSFPVESGLQVIFDKEGKLKDYQFNSIEKSWNAREDLKREVIQKDPYALPPFPLLPLLPPLPSQAPNRPFPQRGNGVVFTPIPPQAPSRPLPQRGNGVIFTPLPPRDPNSPSSQIFGPFRHRGSIYQGYGS